MPDDWTHTATLASSYLHVSEGRVATEALSGDYDLLIFQATWESRGLEIATRADLKARCALILYFNPSHAPQERIAQAVRDLTARLGDRVEHVYPIALNRSTEFHESLNVLARQVTEACRRFDQPPRIGIDISGMPIGYVQGLTGYLLSSGLSASVDCFYVEPKYEEPLGGSATSFTTGSWQLSPVPYLEGKTIGSPDKFIFVCIGAENGSTRELLLGREYTQVAIVKPTHGMLSHWGEQIDRDCDELVSSLNVVGDSYEPANAFSVVEVARYYAEVVAPAWRSAQRMFVAIGTKPHGLAGVICRFSDSALDVFARVPTGYLLREVGAGSHTWRYRLRDLSSAAWALPGYPRWDEL